MKSMKMNKVKHKGKVHPSPSSSSSSSSTPSASSLPAIKDTETALKLLPATILALITILSLEEREVLAYMITRSIKATALNPDIQEKSARKRSSSKKQAVTGMCMVVMGEHKPPVFDCGCFDCYTSYWFRWDSSPNRELIHQAIEGFEEHLARGEKENIAGSGKRRERIGRRGNGKKVGTGEAGGRGKSVSTVVPVAAEVVDAAEIKVEEDEAEAGTIEQLLPPPPQTLAESAEEETEMLGTAVGTAEGPNHKGLARKVLPDVIGLLNSRFWNLWTPNA